MTEKYTLKPRPLALAVFAALNLAHVACAASFTAGNVVIYRAGSGTGSLVNTGSPVFLDEYSSTGTLVQSIALPTAVSGANKRLIASGTASSEGLLSRSADGRFLVLTGYDSSIPASASLSGTTSATVPRTVARVDVSGNVDTTTALTDFANGNNPRSATSSNGLDIWVSGGAGGIRYTTLNSTTSTQLSTTVTNLRQANIFDGQLYVSDSTGTAVRLGTVGTGLPATSGQTITNLPGFATSGSPYGFFFADLTNTVPGVDTLYVADDTNTVNVGGLTKFSLVGSNWVSNGTVGSPSDAYRGLTGSVNGASVTLFATRKGGTGAAGGGELVSLTDTSGYNVAFTGTPTLLATAATNTAFRGVALAPVTPPSQPDLTVSQTDSPDPVVVNNNLTYTLTVSNNGTANASGITVTYTLPSNVTFTGTSVSNGFSANQSGNTVTFSGGSINAASNATLTIAVTPTATGSLTSGTASVDPSNTITESNEGNNSAAAITTTVNAAANTSPTIQANTSTTDFIDGGAGSLNTPFAVTGSVGTTDSTDPLRTLGINFSLADGDTAIGSTTVTAVSSNQTVVPNANITVTGSGTANANVKVKGAAAGYADITVTVSDGNTSNSFVINYAASAAGNASTRFLPSSSDASTAIMVDSNYILVGDDENQALRLYDRTNSGLPVASFDFTSSLGLTQLSGGLPREVDIEASTKVGSRIYWMGSESNASNGNNRPNRNRIFATDISGTGAASSLSYTGRYDFLKDDLLAWDASNGHGLGVNALGFAASSTVGIIPEVADGSGYNIEGLEMAPDNTTAYVAFRAPLQTTSTRDKALIVPVSNFTSLIGNTTQGSATFGAPILLDLGGRAIREIRRNASNQYLIIAGPHDGATGTAPKDFRLYVWTGNPSDTTPVLHSANLTALNADGSFESIVEVPNPLTVSSSLQLLVDNGDTIYYGDGTIAKDLTTANFKKSRSESVTLGTSASGSALSVVTISATDASAAETGTDPATFRISRAGDITDVLTVNYTVTGTASSTDYTPILSGAATIPAGQAFVDVTITPVDDSSNEGDETVIFTLNSNAAYTLGATVSQNVTITDNDVPPPPVNLSVNPASGSEAGQTAITVTATADYAVSGSQTVKLAVSGAGFVASDYSLSSSTITIPSGSTTGSVTLTVLDDAAVEGTETATLTISTPSSGVSLGTTASQNITITDNDSNAACGTAATKISAVQGNGPATSLNTSTTIEGIVVGDYQGDTTNSLRGFFVQEEDVDADGNTATSEGIFVFDGTNPTVNAAVGDRVRVTGTPAEFFNMTQISSVSSVVLCSKNQTIPTPATITLPVPGVPNGNLTTATAVINSYFEAFEGMLVTFPTTLKVSEYFELERYGQLVLSQGGRIPTFTAINTPSVLGNTNQQITLAKRQIILDDSNNIQNFYISNYAATNNIPLPFPTGGLSITNRLRGGDTITNLTGVLHWSFAGLSGTDAWRIRPVNEKYNYSFTSANPRKATSPNVGGTLKVVSENVLNFFTTLDTAAGNCGPTSQDCRGANSTAEYNRQLAKLSQAICGTNADVYGFMELENNATASLDAIKNAANLISGCGPFDYINTGIIGTDAIKVGIMYKTTTVAPVGTYKLMDSTVDARFIDTKNRPSLAQTFSELATNEKFTVVANHLKSKGSACTDVSDPDANDGQGNCNLTRKKAAQALMDWVNSSAVNGGDPDVLLIGDMNSYAKEDPIKAMEMGADDTANTGDEYTNLVKTFNGDKAYSYVFDGQTGYLDHAIASPSLLPQVTGTKDWHINADEPPSFDYNDTVKNSREASFDVKPAALPLYAADQYRTSDHDPVVVGLKLGENFNIINGTAAKDTLSGTTGKDRITGLVGADTLTGGLNNDVFVYVTTADGIDTITDFTLGEDKIDLTALLLSVGYEGNNPIADGIVKFAVSGNNTVVYIDADGTGSAVQRALIVVRNVSVANLNNAANFKF